MYSQGTISTVSGSAIVRGTGTRFQSNINGVAPAQLILIQSSNGNLLHMIQAVNSDTELVLADNASLTLNNVKYQIQTTVPNSISDGVRHMCAINSNIITFLQNMDRWMSENGTVDVTLPNGQTVSLQSIRALQAAMDGKVPSSRKINGKPLTSDIHLIAQDVAAVSANTLGVVNSDHHFQSFLSTGFAVVNIPRVNEVPDFPVGFYSYGILEVQEGHAVVTQRYTSHTGQIAMRQSWDGGNNWRGWYTVWSTGNTTVVDGYLKSASPIIKIWNDGKFETNDESVGATVERLSEGVYLIKNVLGFNADAAWGGVDGGVEIPLCKNKLPLIWVDYKVLPDGSIKLMTYHREHPNAPEFAKNVRQGYSDRDLIDIPDGRYVSVRVQMPADSVWNQKQASSEEE
ncbi:hypothetical protein ID856_14555 [Xenorhabdus sp. 18]|uniref:phage tail fiber protein n=1 Tax=Xenorhabdus doucetiae TaxID=351671 RepID=UPI0019A3421D|nr:hypothetical protein [Xenorhabdus sp. 18]MBD2797747.1 hypothetical protein [Xenorhabdus sp. 18]